MKIKILFILLSFLLLFSSCEKSVDFNPDKITPKLVVEGTIENGQPPVIYISKSLDYFSAINPAILTASFVRDAEVFVSNGTLTHKLKEYSIPAPGGYNFYYYSIDSSNPGTAFTGELNKNYSLRIIWQGNTYTASTTIPNTTRRIDSIFWKQSPAGNPAEKVTLMIRATDPAGYGDYIRYFTRRNSEQLYPGLNSVYDDQIIDGSTYEVQVERGVERTGSQPEGFTYFNKGDTVTLKLCNIDKATFDFWRTMEFTYSSVGNPFSSPTKVISNIKGGGLGYFGGYAAQYRTLIIPQ